MSGLPATIAHAQASGCGAAVVEIVSGAVRVTRTSGLVEPAAPGMRLCPGDTVTSSSGEDVAQANLQQSRAAIRFPRQDKLIRLGSDTTLTISASSADREVTLARGVIYLLSAVRSLFEVKTIYVSAVIDGTEAVIHVLPGEGAAVAVVEGVVSAAALDLAAGDVAFAPPAGGVRRVGPADAASLPTAFRAYVARPRGATDWAAHLPPDLLAPIGGEAVQALSEGRVDAAYAMADCTGAAARRDAEAGACLMLEAVAGADRSVLEAASAASGAGASPEWLIARSYVRQALGDIDGALAAAREARRAGPDLPAAKMRLAETELLVGDAREALRLVEPPPGADCAADDGRSHAIRGFARLAAGRREAAAASFDCAVAQAPADPLGWQGRGLAAIRGGGFEAGIHDLELAVALDPTRADSRVWLGRALLEDGRQEKAAAQFDLAAAADPDDPTPRLFSALERFGANDPIGALAQVEAAEAIGARRATLRGGGGLAEDAGVRGAALSRIYATLGFGRLAALQGIDAAERAPASAEAHYFLSDAYRGRQDFEVAQASELLLADLLAPVGRRLPQSQLAESDLALLKTTGPARTTFAEFAPAFDSDGVYGAATGVIGTQSTFAGEAALGLLHGNMSLAAGHFHSETDGFAFNNDVTHDVTELQFRGRAAVDTTVYAELRRRRTDSGLRTLLRDAYPLDSVERQDFERDSARLGVHHRLSADQSLIATAMIVDSATSYLAPDVPFAGGSTAGPCRTTVAFRDDLDADGGDAQARWIGRVKGLSLTAGASATRIDGRNVFSLTPAAGPCAGPSIPAAGFDADELHASAYAYMQAPLTDWTELSLGLAGAHFEGLGGSTDRVLPKIGLRAEPVSGLVFRAAWLQQVKRPFLADLTLEPTSVAGFNQLYDDGDGAFSELAGLAVDLRAADGVWLGASATRREIETPGYFPRSIIASSPTRSRVTSFEAHAYATIAPRIALALEAEHQRFDGLRGLGGGPLALPKRLDTTSVRGSLAWFHPSGVFAQASATWLRQSETRASGRRLAASEGLVADAAIGWRLPDRRGVIALEGRNLLGADLRYRDVVFDTPRPQSPRYARDPVIALSATFAF